jgi:uncharacterized membrane protein YdbT with pleckstrin-like domain
MPDVYKSDSSEHSKRGAKKKHSSKHESVELSVNDFPGHTNNPFAAFAYIPDNVNFIAADSNERVILLLRKHPITNIPWIITAILMFIAPALLDALPVFDSIPINIRLIASLFWYLITLAFVLEEFLSWFFNVYVVTDERVFDVDFVNLIYREITDANIDQIQDVTTKVGGVIPTLFNYGDVVIQTAAEIPQLEFIAVPRPDTAAQVLRELRVQEETEKIEGRVR